MLRFRVQEVYVQNKNRRVGTMFWEILVSVGIFILVFVAIAYGFTRIPASASALGKDAWGSFLEHVERPIAAEFMTVYKDVDKEIGVIEADVVADYDTVVSVVGRGIKEGVAGVKEGLADVEAAAVTGVHDVEGVVQDVEHGVMSAYNAVVGPLEQVAGDVSGVVSKAVSVYNAAVNGVEGTASKAWNDIKHLL